MCNLLREEDGWDGGGREYFQIVPEIFTHTRFPPLTVKEKARKLLARL